MLGEGVLSGEEDVVLAGELGRGGKLVLFPFSSLFTSISPVTDSTVEEPSAGSGVRLVGKAGLLRAAWGGGEQAGPSWLQLRAHLGVCVRAAGV